MSNHNSAPVGIGASSNSIYSNQGNCFNQGHYGNHYQIAKDEIESKHYSPELVAAAIDIIPDILIDPITKEVVGTPINDALSYRYTRFGHQAKPDHWAIVFYDYLGNPYQLKIFKEGNGFPSKRTGEYRATGKGDKPYLPPIPRDNAIAAAAAVSDECKASLIKHLDNGGYFWDWVKDWTQIPIILTEGCYKALAAINAGYIAASLYGVTCGKKAGRIKPELLPYVQGRRVYLAMDSEWKAATKKHTSLLGNALSHHAKATVKISTWNGKIGKGIDDLFSVWAAAIFHRAIANAQGLVNWQLEQYFSLDGMENLTLNCQNLSEVIQAIPIQKLIGIKSPKKTFKTELLSVWVKDFIKQGGRVIVPVHREQLARDLARRLGIEYRTELSSTGQHIGYCLCIDSLHPNANPGFNVSDWEQFHGYECKVWVIIDEADQVFWHLLNSDTCKHNRPLMLETLTQLVNIADKIILASADLNKVCFDYIQSLLEEPADTYLIVNEWQHQKRECFTFEKPQELFLKLRECIEKGQRLWIATGGQKDKSKWGTRNLERLLSNLYPDLKILRIDRNSVAEPGHPAYGCMGNINAVVSLYDVVIASPTVETGVSINGNHFDGVFCFASGSQTVDAIGQAIERIRANCPRYIWATERVTLQKIGSGSINPWALMHREKSLLKLNQSLNEADNYADFNLGIKAKHLETWAKIAAYHNQGFAEYRESIYALLESNGFALSHLAIADGNLVDNAKEMATQSAEMGHAEYCEKVAAAPIVDDPRAYKALKDKRAKTEAERLSEAATVIANKYSTDDVTADLVDKDSDPQWYGQLRLHFYLKMGDELLKERDQDRIQSLAKASGKVFTPDVNRACLSPKLKLLRDYVGLQDWLDGDRILASDDPALKEWHLKMCKGARDIKKIAGIYVNPDPDAKGNSPIAILNRFLKLLGLKFECIGKQSSGEQCRIYKLPTLDPDGRGVIFDRWLAPAPEPSPYKESGNDLVRNVIGQDSYKYLIKDQSCPESCPVIPDPTPMAAAAGDNADPFTGFHIGQECRLWNAAMGRWINSEIKAVFPGSHGFLKVEWLDGNGGDFMFGRDKLAAGYLAIA